MANKAQQTITIQFGAKGDKDVIKAINDLDKATKALIQTQASIVKSENKKIASTNKHRKAIEKLRVDLQLEGKSLRDLKIPLSQYKKALQGNDLALAKLRRTTKRYIKDLKRQDKGILDTAHGNRILGGSFAVLRSKMLLASFGAGLFGASVGRVTKMYGVQERAEKKLETALGKRSRALLQFASQQQKITKFGDEETISVMSLVGAYTSNEKVISKITKASMDLASAKGMSLTSAVDLVSKSIFSSTNALSRYGINIEGTEGSVQRLTSATTKLSELYGGQAEAEAKTFLGAIQQMNNAVGDTGELIGLVFAPTVLKGARAIKEFSESLTIEHIKAYGTALVTVTGLWGVYTVWVNRASLATLKFGKALKLSGLGLAIAGVGALIDKLDLFGDDSSKLSEELKKLNGEIENMGLKSKVATSESLKLLEAQMSLGTTTEHLHPIYEEEKRVKDELALIKERHSILDKNGNKVIIDSIQLQTEMTQNEEKGLIVARKKEEAEIKAVGTMFTALSQLAGQNKKDALLARDLAVAGAVVDMYAGANKAFKQGGTLGFLTGASIIAQGVANIKAMKAEKFEQGGLIGGQRHSQGGTLIEAERGEFVMSRNAVDSIGINNLNAMNQGTSPITLNISAPLVDETVIDSIIPAIEKAQRMNLA